jgi:hypothetical protein
MGCDLGRGIVFVRPRVEFLDLSVLQLPLEVEMISCKPSDKLETYSLCVVIVGGPISSNGLDVISQCVIFICCQV